MLENVDNSEYPSVGGKIFLMPKTRVVDASDARWLAAMLETEGTFTFQYNEQEKDGRVHTHIQPRVIFVNSDVLLVNSVEKVARGLGFGFRRGEPKLTGMGKKLKVELQYSGFHSLPLLKLLRPYIVGEKAECVDCMIEFIEFRHALAAAGKPKAKYSEVEYGLLRRVRAINSGHWRQVPKFSQISMEVVEQRRSDHAKTKLAIVS